MTYSYDVMSHVTHMKRCSVLQCVAVCGSVLSRADTHSYDVRGARNFAMFGAVVYRVAKTDRIP